MRAISARATHTCVPIGQSRETVARSSCFVVSGSAASSPADVVPGELLAVEGGALEQVAELLPQPAHPGGS